MTRDPDPTGYAPDGYYDPNEIAAGHIVDDDDPRTRDTLDQLADLGISFAEAPREPMPAGAVIDLDRAGFARELEAEYIEVLERVRDAAQEARHGAEWMRQRAYDAQTPDEWQRIGAPVTPAYVADRRQARQARDYADELPNPDELDVTHPRLMDWPVLRAALTFARGSAIVDTTSPPVPEGQPLAATVAHRTERERDRAQEARAGGHIAQLAAYMGSRSQHFAVPASVLPGAAGALRRYRAERDLSGGINEESRGQRARWPVLDCADWSPVYIDSERITPSR